MTDPCDALVHHGMVHRCLTTDSCHSGNAVCAQCNKTIQVYKNNISPIATGRGRVVRGLHARPMARGNTHLLWGSMGSLRGCAWGRIHHPNPPADSQKGPHTANRLLRDRGALARGLRPPGRRDGRDPPPRLPPPLRPQDIPAHEQCNRQQPLQVMIVYVPCVWAQLGGGGRKAWWGRGSPSPPPCKSNSEVPRFDGNNTSHCSEREQLLPLL